MKEIQGTLVLETLDEIANPKHTALLVIDVQNDNSSPKGFLASKGRDIPWIREAIPRIKMVLEEVRGLGLLVIFVRRTRSRDGSLESGPRLRLYERSPYGQGAPEYLMEGAWGNEVLVNKNWPTSPPTHCFY
ncbi:MAG: cysteine hydrolase family protein [Thermodesulfobacteriota bacterium]|nr:cysteine hydrolase family protein [Thermodesulfobacteriota bacterium]